MISQQRAQKERKMEPMLLEYYPDLVTISPEEVLRSDILVWVFHALFQGR